VSLAVLERSMTMPMPKPSSRREQTDWSWAQHAGQRIGDPIPESARRAVRNLKRQLAPRADAVVDVLESGRWRELAADWAWKRSDIGKARALAKLRKLFPAPVEIKQLGPLGRVLYIPWLEPHSALLDHQDPSFGQSGIVSRAFVLLGAVRGRVLPISIIGLETPDHALARQAQRAPNANPVGTLSAATQSFLAMDIESAVALNTDSMFLPVGGEDGFLANCVFGRTDGHWRIFGRPRTFLGPAQVNRPPPVAPSVDIAKSVLVAVLTLMSRRELPGGASPLSPETLAELEQDYDATRRTGT